MQTRLFFWLDSFLIRFFRITGITTLDYFIGLILLALICVLTGQLTYCWVFRKNHRYLFSSGKEMLRMHTLSLQALKASDKTAYTSCNVAANDAFGKYFFAQIATNMAAIWPVPFVLAWMQRRFYDVDFHLPFHLPAIGATVGYLFTFLPIYILIYVTFNFIKPRLPYFKQFDQWMHEMDQAINTKQ